MWVHLLIRTALVKHIISPCTFILNKYTIVNWTRDYWSSLLLWLAHLYHPCTLLCHMQMFIGMGYKHHKFNYPLTSGHRSDIRIFRFLIWKFQFNQLWLEYHWTNDVIVITLYTPCGFDICQDTIFFIDQFQRKWCPIFPL